LVKKNDQADKISCVIDLKYSRVEFVDKTISQAYSQIFGDEIDCHEATERFNPNLNASFNSVLALDGD
jgi:hypothetical protein